MGKAGDPRQPPGREGPADNLQGQQHPRPPLPDLDPAGAEGATAHIPGAPPPRGGPSGYRGVLLHASAGLCAHGAPPSRQCREGGRRCVRGPARPGKVTNSPCAHKAAHEDKGGAGRPPSLGHTEQPHQTLLWRRGLPGACQAAAPAAPPRTCSSRLRHTRHRSCPAQPPPIRYVHPPQRPLSTSRRGHSTWSEEASEGLNGTAVNTEKWTGDPEDRTLAITRSEQQKEKRI